MINNKINRALPKQPQNQKQRNGILINGFKYNENVMDCGIGGNVNAYQFNYPDEPKIYRFFGSKPNFNLKIQNRDKIDEEEDGTPIWGEIKWETPIIQWRPLTIERMNLIFPSIYPELKQWLNVVYLNEIYWIPPNTEFKVDPETNFIVGRKIYLDENEESIFEEVNWNVMSNKIPFKK